MSSIQKRFFIVFFSALLSFSLFGSVSAFSFFDIPKIFSEIKIRILNPEKKQIVLKKESLAKAIELSRETWQEQTNLLKESCPLREKEISQDDFFEKIVFLSLSEDKKEKAENLLPSQIFSTLSLEEKEGILFEIAACQQLSFSLEEERKLNEFRERVEEEQTLAGIEKLAQEFAQQREKNKDKEILNQEIVSIIKSEKDIETAIERVKKISLDLSRLKKENPQAEEILGRLFLLAQKEAEKSFLQTKMAKIIFIYSYPFGLDRDLIDLTRKSIKIQIEIDKETGQPLNPLLLIEKSQKDLNSAYQILLLMSQMVNG